MLEIAGGTKDEVANAQRRCAPAETVDSSWVITREIGDPGDAWRREKSWVHEEP